MALKTVRLELARNSEFPEGRPSRGYEFVAPLDGEGRLDVEEWPAVKGKCTVRRFWEGEGRDQHGELHHTRHRTWAFSYQPGEDDDEHFFHLDTHSLRVGEYVSIKETDGRTMTFKIVSVT